jgi:hypothetical protein
VLRENVLINTKNSGGYFIYFYSTIRRYFTSKIHINRLTNLGNGATIYSFSNIPCFNNVVEGNKITVGGKGLWISCPNSNNNNLDKLEINFTLLAIIRRNVISKTREVSIYVEASATRSSDNTAIYHNTIVMSQSEAIHIERFYFPCYSS